MLSSFLKHLFIPLILVVTVTVSTGLYRKRSAHIHHPIDLLRVSLQPVPHIVPNGKIIRFKTDVTDPALYFQCQYVLTPLILTTKDTAGKEWMLGVFRQVPDSFISAVSAVKWQAADSVYHYVLTKDERHGDEQN